MNNPFSNRVCIDASDYILKKKRLAKIENLKSTQYANYKTSTYHVTSSVKPEPLKKSAYPKEPKFLPNPILNYHSIEIHHLNLKQYGDFKVSSQSFDNYDKLSYEASSYNELYDGQYPKGQYPKGQYPKGQYPKDKNIEKHTNIFNPKCKKCSNDLACMKNPPEEWYCDGWDPPETHCVGGNNIKLDKDSKAYCCPNVQHCNWILCEKCYISIGKKNKTLYCKPEEPEEDNCEYKLDELEIRKRIETEAQIMLRDKIENMRKCAPSLKCFSSYEEYLDLAKGFHLTEPFCENTYQNDGLNINNGKLVENISEGRFSVIDMDKDCLYEKNNFKYPRGFGENAIVYKDLVVDKCREEKGLINLRATVLPKLKTERIFKFPLTIKKTHFCSNGVDKISHNPVNFSDKKHLRWLPTRNTFIKFRSDKRKPLHGTLQSDISNRGKRNVLDLNNPEKDNWCWGDKVKIGNAINHPYASYRAPTNKKCNTCNHTNNHLFEYKVK